MSKQVNESKVIQIDRRKITRQRFVQGLSVAASIVLFAFIISYTFFQKQEFVPVQTIPSTDVVENTLVHFSGKQLIVLPDKSTVLLNENSSLK